MLAFAIMIVCLVEVFSTPAEEFSGTNKMCQLAFRAGKALTGNNDTCWVCQEKSLQLRVFPYRTAKDSVCAAARMCTTPKCLENMDRNSEQFLEGPSINEMLTVMDSVWLHETNEQSDRKISSISSESVVIQQMYPWPAISTIGLHIPVITKPFTICNENDMPLRPSGENLDTHRVPLTLGHVCLTVSANPRDNSTRQHLGRTKCQYYINATYGWNEPDNIRPETHRNNRQFTTGIYLGGKYFPRIRFSSVPHPNFNFALPIGLYWICGNIAYSHWPARAIGTCYIAAVSQAMYNLHKEHFLSKPPHRHKRDLSRTPGGMLKYNGYVLANPWTGQAATAGLAFSLWGGVVAALQKINGLAYEVQGVANDTADAMALINTEIKGIRTELVAQRLALDLVFAQEGGLCKVISTSCCF